ncbi:MAG TPA: SagB/ThcOx family dehydrogenase, partial [Candidatus Limnocylindrales bacterium]
MTTSANTTSSTASDRPAPRRTGSCTRSLVAAIALAGVLLAGLFTSDSRAPQRVAQVTALDAAEALPSPRSAGPIAFEEALRLRRSVRSFSPDPLTLAEIGQLLWAAQGVTDAEGHRTAPSAGARYPLEVDALTAAGIARYVPEVHSLVSRSAADARSALERAALDQASVGSAPLVIAISAVVERTEVWYGADRAERYVALEAGHAAQNVLLEAVSLGLGAVPVGAFDDAAVGRIL